MNDFQQRLLLTFLEIVGNVIKQSQAGSTAFTKTVYDELNRPKVSYLCCRPGVAGVPAGDDNSVVDDTVIEQSNVVYDRGGNVIMQTRKQRFDDATGTGVLNGPQTEPKSRDTYGMTWPDALGRPRVSADYGTNGGSVPTRREVAPQRSDTILVSTNRYKDSGDANAVVDPMGIETRWENDQAGRRIRLIEGIASPYVVHASACSAAPYPPHPTPRVTEFGWHPSGQLNKLTLVNAETGNQVTRWLFGTTLADSAIASNGLVRTKIYPESDDRPAPAADGPDGVYSRLEYRYNRQGQQTAFKDADGTTHEHDYDKLGNPTEDRVTALADGLNDDVLRIGTTYDQRGLTAKVTSYDAASGGSVVNEVGLEYNSFRQLAADKQSHDGAVDGSTPKVNYSYESGGTKNSVRRISTTYPTSTRVVEVKYGAANSMDDHLGRVSALQVTGETDELVNYTYCGRAWQVRVAYPAPGVELKYRRLSGEPVGDAGDPYSGYDRFGRTVDMPWIKTSDGSIVERSQYGFDRNSRRTWQKRPLTDMQDQQYNYDTLSQVNAAARGSLNLNATAISGVPASAESWDYDPTGNWRGYHSAAAGTSTLDQHRVHDRGNRLTQIEDNPHNMILDRVGRMRQMAPDAEGNWDGKLELTWDAWSRITSVKNNGEVVGEYAYDGTHRRITREVAGETLHSYYNDAWRPVEERKNAEPTASISYLWGARHRDDLVRRDRAVGGTTLNETRYVLMDYFNSAAATDESGTVIERYAFSAFGVRSILNPDYTVRGSSEGTMEFAFQGQFLDVESGLMNYGYRYYSTQLGRWMCKDPVGERGGFNLYGVTGNNAVNSVDAFGLFDPTFIPPFIDPSRLPKPPTMPTPQTPVPVNSPTDIPLGRLSLLLYFVLTCPGDTQVASARNCVDDAKRRCKCISLRHVKLWVVPRGNGDPYPVGHAAIELPQSSPVPYVGPVRPSVNGFTNAASITSARQVVPGTGTDEPGLPGHQGAVVAKTYSVCPETLAILIAAIRLNWNLNYQLTNEIGYNCAGWVCKNIEEAALPTPNSVLSNQPILKPEQLLPTIQK